MVSHGPWPSTLAVGGALSLKAVAGLRVLVNAASVFVHRIIARAISCVKSAIRRILGSTGALDSGIGQAYTADHVHHLRGGEGFGESKPPQDLPFY